MSIPSRVAQIAGLGLLLLGGCTVNNPAPAPIVVREQAAPTTTFVTPSTSAPSTVVLQPR